MKKVSCHTLLFFVFLLAGNACKDTDCRDTAYSSHYMQLLDREIFRVSEELFKYRTLADFTFLLAVDSIKNLSDRSLKAVYTYSPEELSKFKYDSVPYGFDSWSNKSLKLPGFSLFDTIKTYSSPCKQYLITCALKKYELNCLEHLKKHLMSDLFIHDDIMFEPKTIKGNKFIQIGRFLPEFEFELFEKRGDQKIRVHPPIMDQGGYYLLDLKRLRKGTYEIIIERQTIKGVEILPYNFTN